jgi:hypothetical protein
MDVKVVFFAFRNHEMCFTHLMLNALDIAAKGGTAKIIFEGESVKLPAVLMEKKNPLYQKCIEQGIFAGVCEACSRQMGVYEANQGLPFPLLGEMKGHPSMEPYLRDGYQVVTL